MTRRCPSALGIESHLEVLVKINQWMVLALGLTVVSCGKDKRSAQDGLMTGYVLDQDQQPIAGAAIALAGTSSATTSDRDGAYTLALKAPADFNVVVSVQSAGFVRQALTTQIPRANSDQRINFTLQKTGMSVAVLLPDAGQPPAQVATAGKDGAVALGLPAGSLVDETGAVVTGTVDVDLTYFHPRQARSTMPVSLATQDPNGGGAVPLVTFGMADINVWQNGKALLVAPGATLDLDFTAIAAQSTYVQDHNQDSVFLPQLYSADMNTGMWVHEAALGSDKLTYEPASKQFKAKLSHLSS